MALEQATTSHGLDVYVDHIPTAETTQMYTYVGVGSVYEAPHEAGLAHALEHVVHLQTSDFPDKPSLMLYRGLHGITAKAKTGHTRTLYTAGGPEIEPLVHQMSEIVCRPIFDAPAVSAEMKVIAEEARRRFGMTAGMHEVAADNVLFGEPYGRDQIGHHDNILYSPDELRQFYERCYTLGNMAVVAVGSATTEEVVTLAERYFTPSTRPYEALHPQPVQRRLTTDIRSGLIADAKTTYFIQAAPLSADLRADIMGNTPAYSAAENALSTHLLNVLRDEENVAYNAWFLPSTYNHPDAWRVGVYTSAKAEDIPVVEEGARRMVERQPHDYTENEILAAIGLYKGKILKDMDSLTGRIDVYDRALTRLGELHDVKELATQVRDLSEGEVRVAMSRMLDHFQQSPKVTHLTGTAEAIGEVEHVVKRSDIA